MQIIDKLYEGLEPLYPIERFCKRDKALFIDIETTGLKKETTSLYLIGLGYYTDEGFMTKLLFADSEDEEKLLLDDLKALINDFSHLFHFNGMKFDIPYLEYKAAQHNVDGLFGSCEQVDIYKLCKPLRYLLFADSMRQKSIEQFLGINREDKYNGGELIAVYKEYTVSRRPSDLNDLITHNREDVLGMHLIMPILYYLEFRDAQLKYTGHTVNSYCDYNGNECEEIILEYTTDLYFPRSFVAKTETMYVRASAENHTLSIRLPIYDCEMKLFFENYRDYSYLPGEDRAILKTVAASLPKESFVKATRETCYRKVTGRFVKEPCSVFTPVLRENYKDKKKYFKYPDSFKKEAADEFGRELINIFFTMKRR